MKRPASESEYAKHWAEDESVGPVMAVALSIEAFRWEWDQKIMDLPHPKLGITFLRVLRAVWRLFREWDKHA